MAESQPGYDIKMVAIPGHGDTLRRLVTDGMTRANAGGTWVTLRDEIIDHLAEPPLRIPVTPFSASWLPRRS